MVRHTAALVLVLLAAAFCSRSVAQDALSSRTDPRMVELVRTRDATQRAIEDGTHTQLELAGLYAELAMEESRLGDSERARAAFTVALALDPSLRVGAGLPAEVRSPFMEAKGFWSGHPVRLEVNATLEEDGSALLLNLTDPAHLCARVRLRARRQGERDYREAVLVPRESLRALVSGARQSPIEYNLTLLDEYGNRIFQAGGDERPLHLTPQTLPASPQPLLVKPETNVEEAKSAPFDRPTAPPEGPRNGRRYYWAAALSLTASGAALSGGVWAHMQREKLADDWNRGTCEGSGVTRGTVCADEREELSSMDRLALGLYAGGSALLITGLVLLIVAPSSGEQRPERTASRSWFCTQGPGQLGLGCAAKF